LLASAAELGLEEQEFLRVLRPQARRLAGRLRTPVRPDGQPDTDRAPAIDSLLARLGAEA
jgi:hypothetical protein